MATFSWTPCAARPFLEPPPARMGHIAVAVDASAVWGDEFVVIHGGLGGDKRTLDDIAVLPTSDESWFRPDAQVPFPSSAASDISRAPSSPAASTVAGGSDAPARAFHSGVALGRCVYIFGGHYYHRDRKGLQKYNDVWSLNTDNWEWTRMIIPPHSPRPPARDFASILALPGKRLLVFGGLDGAERRLDDAWILDVTTSTWSEVKVGGGPRPRARFGQSMFQVEQRVLLFGGEGPSGVTNDLWALRGVVAADADVAPAWAPLELPGPAPIPRKGHAAACVGGQVLIMGGHSSENSWFRAKQDMLLNDLIMLDRTQGVHWAAPDVQGALPAAREFHTLTPLSGGSRLLLFGGGNGKTVFGDAWWLNVSGDLMGAPFGAPGTPSFSSMAPLPPRVPSFADARTISVTPSGLDRSGSAARSIADGSRSLSLQPGLAMKQLYKRVGVSTMSSDAVARTTSLGRINSMQSTNGILAKDVWTDSEKLLEKLGEQFLSGTDKRLSQTEDVPSEPLAAARHLLAHVPPHQLTLQEVEVLMLDYRGLSTVGMHCAIAAAGAAEIADGDSGVPYKRDAGMGGEQRDESSNALDAAGGNAGKVEGTSTAEKEAAVEGALQQVAAGLMLFADGQLTLPGRWCHMQSHILRVCDVRELQEEYRTLLC